MRDFFLFRTVAFIPVAQRIQIPLRTSQIKIQHAEINDRLWKSRTKCRG